MVAVLVRLELRHPAGGLWIVRRMVWLVERVRLHLRRAAVLVVVRNEVLVRIVLALLLGHAVVLHKVLFYNWMVHDVAVDVVGFVRVMADHMVAIVVMSLRHSVVHWKVVVMRNGFVLLRSWWSSRTSACLLHIDVDNGGRDSHFRLLLRFWRLSFVDRRWFKCRS